MKEVSSEDIVDQFYDALFYAHASGLRYVTVLVDLESGAFRSEAYANPADMLRKLSHPE